MGSEAAGTPLDSIAHIIQTSLAPVFLLSGVATLINTLATRLARISDLMQRVSAQLDEASPGNDKAQLLQIRLKRLQQRNTVLVAAMVSGTVAGASTCSAILTLFVGALSDKGTASVLFALFGIAVVCTTGALVALLAEIVLAWHGLRTEAAFARAKHLFGASDL